MQYALLIYSDHDEAARRTAEEDAAIHEQHRGVLREMQQRGVWRYSEKLERAPSAKTLRIRRRRRNVTDGPFAETKEQLGGFFVIECDSIDEAIDWAARFSTAEYGCVEVRPVAA